MPTFSFTQVNPASRAAAASSAASAVLAAATVALTGTRSSGRSLSSRAMLMPRACASASQAAVSIAQASGGGAPKKLLL